jgi:hypothetical protein
MSLKDTGTIYGRRALNNLERRIDAAGIARFIWLAGDNVIPISDLFSLYLG